MKLPFVGIAAALVLVPIVCGAAEASSRPSTTENIEEALVNAPRGWTSIWTPLGAEDWERPAGTGRARFVRREGELYEIFVNYLLGRVCVNKIFIDDGGLTRFGCTRVPKRMAFQPHDPLVPFSGQAENGYAYRLVPQQ